MYKTTTKVLSIVSRIAFAIYWIWYPVAWFRLKPLSMLMHSTDGGSFHILSHFHIDIFFHSLFVSISLYVSRFRSCSLRFMDIFGGNNAVYRLIWMPFVWMIDKSHWINFNENFPSAEARTLTLSHTHTHTQKQFAQWKSFNGNNCSSNKSKIMGSSFVIKLYENNTAMLKWI